MSVSSNESAAILARLTPGQITLLMGILATAKVRQRTFIAEQYLERGRHFEETLAFLKLVGWVRELRGELYLTDCGVLFRSRYTSVSQAKKGIVDIIADSPSAFQMLLARYLGCFSDDNRRITYTPSVRARLQQSAIRDFLMLAGAVKHDVQRNHYELSQEFLHLYLWAKNVGGVTSKAQFRANLAQKEKIGLLAELAVVEYEKAKVGKDWADRVIHVSAKNPGACFDIQSLRLIGGQVVKRYIEVKAVPIDSFQFYWTASEIQASLMLSNAYFLYLVPVVKANEIDLSRMEVIEEAYQNVYKSPDQWVKDEEVIICRRRTPSKSL